MRIGASGSASGTRMANVHGDDGREPPNASNSTGAFCGGSSPFSAVLQGESR